MNARNPIPNGTPARGPERGELGRKPLESDRAQERHVLEEGRWTGAVVVDAQLPAVRVRRAIVDGQLTIPKSRYGLRTVPIPPRLAAELSRFAAMREGGEDLLFRGPQGGPVRPNNLRQRVLVPAAERAGVPWARFHTLRHTCASLLAEAGAGPIRLQRWMGHHSAGFTLDTYGHLIDGDLGPGLDLSVEHIPDFPVIPRTARVSKASGSETLLAGRRSSWCSSGASVSLAAPGRLSSRRKR